ncbi:MAG: hypothetical protein HQL98_12290 [Magnetococcales bacterium]|nr:hypothetical protein [Magnetococcales bacterium]
MIIFSIDVSGAGWLDELENGVGPAFLSKNAKEKLRIGLSKHVRGVIVERPYSDKDYRSTYYSHFSKKIPDRGRDCVRVHFFSHFFPVDSRKSDFLDGLADQKEFQKHYLGFMVLRPGDIVSIGRTVLDTNAVEGAAGCVLKAEYKVHLLGMVLKIRGFPFMSQDTEISICAHVTSWAILRYFSQKFS